MNIPTGKLCFKMFTIYVYDPTSWKTGSVPGEKNPMKNIFTLQSSLGLSFIETKFSTNMHLIQKVFFRTEKGHLQITIHVLRNTEHHVNTVRSFFYF